MKTLLVLEDEPTVMDVLRPILKQYRVIEATTAEEALRAFRDHRNQIDLLVADLTLPQASGLQVALLLRLENPNLPVILTSGYPVSYWTGRDYTDLERLGSTLMVLIEKPFQVQVLRDAACELIEAPTKRSIAVAAVSGS